MKTLLSFPVFIKLLFYSMLSFISAITMAADPPFTILTNIFDQSKPDDLGLTIAEGTETVSIFKPNDTTDHFSNGAFMTVFKDVLYCQWQSSATDEDAQDTWVAYSRSEDGINWSPPMVLAESIEEGYCSSGGWWNAGDTLVAYINTWPSSVNPRGGFTRYTTTTDGLTWSEIKPLPMVNEDTLKGIFEQDPHTLPGGRIISAAHFQPGLIVSPVYTDDISGIRGWTKADFTNMPNSGSISREIEPSWFLRDDGAAVMVFRDQNSSYKKLASVSLDQGESWTTPVLTDMPDARTKQSAGNIGDSTAYLAGNPVNNKTRLPLVVTLSSNGHLFNTAYLLRHGDSIQDLRYTGNAKRAGYHYPKSIVYQDYLYVSYTTNKEDVEYTRVPVQNLILDTITVNILPLLPKTSKIKIMVDGSRYIKVLLTNDYETGTVRIFNLNGQLLDQRRIYNNEICFDLLSHPVDTYIIDVRTNLGRKTKIINIR